MPPLAASCTAVGVNRQLQLPAIANAAAVPCRFRGLFWKFARVGERLSPWVAFACIFMAVSVVFF